MALRASVVLPCPKCGKRYQVDPELVQQGKRVRCRACSAVFVASADHKPSLLVDEDQILAWLQHPRAEQ
jgi:predicted Zn finger-like uncharacterized protein